MTYNQIIKRGEYMNIQWTLDEKGTLTISGEGDMPDWNVSIFETNSMLNVAWHQYSSKKRIIKAVIECGITTVGEGAFADCFNLEEVILPEGIRFIKNCAFNGCISLHNISIPYSVEGICEGAFSRCFELRSIALPDNLIFIGRYAFWNSGLEYVKLPNDMEGIGNLAFYECRNLKYVDIPASLVELEESVFEHCSNLESIHVDAENQYFSSIDGVLFNKKQTKIICYPPNRTGEYYRIPPTVTYIKGNAFYDCNNLVHVYIPGSVTQIEFHPVPFVGNSLMENIEVSEDNQNYSSVDGVLLSKDKSIILEYPCNKKGHYDVPEFVTNITYSAFAKVIGLKSIYIHEKVDIISDVNIFGFGCSLEKVDVSANNAFFSSVDGILFDKEKTTLLNYPVRKQGKVYSIPDSVQDIVHGAFYDNPYIEEIYISHNVERISEGAFDCENLKKIEIDKDNENYIMKDGKLWGNKECSVLWEK